MKTTIVDLLTAKLMVPFAEFESHPEYSAFVLKGTPVAFWGALREKMMTEKKTEVSIKVGDLMEFGLKASKRGDSIAFAPTFELTQKGQELISEDNLSIDSDSVIAIAVQLLQDEIFAKACHQALMLRMPNDDNEWIENDATKKIGLEFDETEDSIISVIFTLATIIEVLANNKDASKKISYEVPGFGTFNIEEVKGKWLATCDFDPEYKGKIKNDQLGELIASLDIL